MASSASATISLLSSCGTPLVDGRAARRHAHCLPLSVYQNGDSSLKTISMPLGRRIAGSGIGMATGETQYVDTSETLVSTSKAPDAPPESTIVAPSAEAPLAISEASATLEAPAEFASEVPEIVKTLQTAVLQCLWVININGSGTKLTINMQSLHWRLLELLHFGALQD